MRIRSPRQRVSRSTQSSWRWVGSGELALEGKLQAEGLQAMDEDADMLTAMARELVTGGS
jgi:hypothetical protein